MAKFTLADDPHGHVPVLRDRMAELLAPAVEAFGQNAVLVDGTLGAGDTLSISSPSFPTPV